MDDPRFDRVSALVQAAGVGDLPTVELLLEQNVTPYSTIDETRRTPLHEAASFGHAEVVQTLIRASIHRDQLNLVLGATDQRHRTPLHYAAFGGHVDVARVLLEHGAVIDAGGPDGLQPLHLAVIKGDETMVKFLLARGAHVLVRDAEGRTAKDYARALHHDHLARSLEEETRRYWQNPTVRGIRATIENYLAAFESGDVSTARTLSTKHHDEILGDSIKALSFQHVIEEIKWDKDAAQATVRIEMPSGMIPFFGFFDLKKNKEGWKVDYTNYGFIEKWEDMK
ncbi:MAG: ankyrin repeat domain-containing protein [Deltaproteobacteria bacterium]|nr:ankyrin repeat domain-containing protein [Deltaproteobacteria bacterium]